MPFIDTRIDCLNCKYYKGGGVCVAFPERIPDEIIVGLESHYKVLDGQVGDYIYEVKDEYRAEAEKKMKKDLELVHNFEVHQMELVESIRKEIINFRDGELKSVRFYGFMKSGGRSSIGLYTYPELEFISWDLIDVVSGGSNIFRSFVKVAEADRVKCGFYRKVEVVVYSNGDYSFS
jgi:hypothetical protein